MNPWDLNGSEGEAVRPCLWLSPSAPNSACALPRAWFSTDSGTELLTLQSQPGRFLLLSQEQRSRHSEIVWSLLVGVGGQWCGVEAQSAGVPGALLEGGCPALATPSQGPAQLELLLGGSCIFSNTCFFLIIELSAAYEKEHLFKQFRVVSRHPPTIAIHSGLPPLLASCLCTCMCTHVHTRAHAHTAESCALLGHAPGSGVGQHHCTW